MASIPRDPRLDNTLALLNEGYPFILRRCREFQSDLFETRIMLRKVICMTGAEAAQTFYQPGRFTRRGALPPTTLRLLLDKGSVQLLDADAHQHRKQMFMSIMTPERLAQITEVMDAEWRSATIRWAGMNHVVLHTELQEILCRTVCAWAGIPLPDSEVHERTRAFAAMIEGAGAVGPSLWKGLLLRSRTERWARDIIDRTRSGDLPIPKGTAAHVIAWHRDPDGRLLDVDVAAVELINVLRPTVAVARFITFAALALYRHSDWHDRIAAGHDDIEPFVQEVRRYYPFFPFIGGRVREEFDWQGHRFTRGTWVLLDLYGTNRDPRVWDSPDEFRPERFRDWSGSPFNFVPQGGGEFERGHRCAGEWLTIALVKRAVQLLTNSMTYTVPKQDLRIRLARMPTIPNSRFILTDVRPTA